MGLSFHYSAVIRNYNDLDAFIDEVADLSSNMEWAFSIIVNEHVKGIVVAPKGSEPLWLCFTPDGKSCSIPNLKYKTPGDEFYTTIHIKTQFAGPDTHIALINLLRYLAEKYFSEILVYDEGNYWETADQQVLLNQFQRFDAAFEVMSGILSGFKGIPGESADSLTARLEKILKEKSTGV
jgi:hypothetical protein